MKHKEKCNCRCHRGPIGKEFTEKFGYCAKCMDFHCQPSEEKECKCTKAGGWHYDCSIHGMNATEKGVEGWEGKFNKYYGLMFECGDYEQLINDIHKEIQSAKREGYDEGYTKGYADKKQRDEFKGDF